MASQPSAPKAPQLGINSVASPSYVSPGNYTSQNLSQELSTLYNGLSGPTSESYPSAYTLANNAQAADVALGPSLSIIDNSGPGGLTNVSNGSASGQAAYQQDFYNNDILPGIASAQQSVYNNGQQNSTAGGAEIGTAYAQGAAQAGLAGQQYYTNALNNFLDTRSSFAGLEGGLATNSAQGSLTASQNNNANTLNYDQILANLNSTLSGYESQNSTGLNAYNLANSQNNNTTNSQNYSTTGNIYNDQLNALNQEYATAANIYGTQAGMYGSQLNASTAGKGGP